jgi:hypothetical protein
VPRQYAVHRLMKVCSLDLGINHGFTWKSFVC